MEANLYIFMLIQSALEERFGEILWGDSEKGYSNELLEGRLTDQTKVRGFLHKDMLFQEPKIKISINTKYSNSRKFIPVDVIITDIVKFGELFDKRIVRGSLHFYCVFDPFELIEESEARKLGIT